LHLVSPGLIAGGGLKPADFVAIPCLAAVSPGLIAGGGLKHLERFRPWL